MYCPDCGHSNNESNTFCMKCGKNLKEASENNYNETMSENEYNLVYDSDKKNYIFSFVSSIAGVLLCVLGCFLPFVSMNLGFVNNSMKYIDGDGKIVCGIMGLAILLSILKYQKLNIVTSASVLIMLGIELYPLFYSESGEYIDGLIDFEVGFYFVIIGAVTILVGAIVAFKGKWDKTNKSVFIAFSVISIILIAVFFTISNESDNKNDENNEIAVDYTTTMQTEATNTITISITTNINKVTTNTRTKATTLPSTEIITGPVYFNADISGEWYDINGSGVTMYIEERDSGYYAEFRDSKSSYSWHMSGGHYDDKYDIFDVFLFDNTTCVNVYTVNGMVQTEHIYQNKVARIGFSLECAFVVIEGDATFDECYFVRN